MAKTNQEAINTFISITGASEAVALRKLKEHGRDLNAAVYAHFSEGDRSGDRNVSGEASNAPDFDDSSEYSNDMEEEMIQSAIEASKQEAREHVGDLNAVVNAHFSEGDRNVSCEARGGPNSPDFDDLSEYSNDMEEEMIRAAIEASKQEAQLHGSDPNAAVNAYFSEGDRSGVRNVVHETYVATHQDDLLDIDDPIEVPIGRNPLSRLLEASRTNQEAINTFISITGASEAVTLQQLEQNGNDLNAAVNAYFSEGDRSRITNVVHEASSELPVVHQASSGGNAIQHNEIPNTDFHAVQTTSEALDLTPSASACPIGDEIVEVGQVHYPSIDSSPVDLSCPPVESISNKTDGKKEDGGSSSCVICLDAPVEGACVPCGHMAGCMSCLNEIKTKKLDCPVCRVKIDQVIKLYAV